MDQLIRIQQDEDGFIEPYSSFDNDIDQLERNNVNSDESHQNDSDFLVSEEDNNASINNASIELGNDSRSDQTDNMLSDFLF